MSPERLRPFTEFAARINDELALLCPHLRFEQRAVLAVQLAVAEMRAAAGEQPMLELQSGRADN